MIKSQSKWIEGGTFLTNNTIKLMNLRVQHVEFNINNSTQLTYDLISLYFPIETKQYTFGFKQTLLYFQPGRFYWKVYFPFQLIDTRQHKECLSSMEDAHLDSAFCSF